MKRRKQRGSVDPHLPPLVNAATAIEARLDELLAYAPFVAQPEAVTPLHAMRIAAKRLRYTLEIFLPLYTEQTPYGAEMASLLEMVKTFQEILGTLHDADVLAPQLTDYLAQMLREGYGTTKSGEPKVGVHLVDWEGCQGLLTLCRETVTEREAAYQALVTRWGEAQQAQTFDRLRTLIHLALQPPAEPPAEPPVEPAGETPPKPARTRRRRSPAANETPPDSGAS